MGLQYGPEYDSQRAAIGLVTSSLSMMPGVLSNQVGKAEIGGRPRASFFIEDKARLKGPARENCELRRAKEILNSAAVLFGAGLPREAGAQRRQETESWTMEWVDRLDSRQLFENIGHIFRQN